MFGESRKLGYLALNSCHSPHEGHFLALAAHTADRSSRVLHPEAMQEGGPVGDLWGGPWGRNRVWTVIPTDGVTTHFVEFLIRRKYM